MKINLSQFVINFPDKPDNIREDEPYGKTWHDYTVSGLINKIELGKIRISLAVKYPPHQLNDFWHNMDENPPRARPVVAYQETEEKFFGNGISGRIIILANEIVKIKFNEPLASDTLFVSSIYFDYQERGFAKYPSRRVWEKLEEQGLAYRRDCNHPRWIMK